MNDFRTQFSDLEARLKAANISVSEVCRRTDIAYTTWLRWRTIEDRRPQGKKWRLAAQAAAELLAKAEKVAA